MKRKVGEFYKDVYAAGDPFVETQARTDFNAARDYAISLVEIHDSLTGGVAGRPPIQLEALKRSALILAVTAWESFVEDTVKQQLKIILDAASTPSQIQSIFNSAAQEWLEPEGGKRVGPNLVSWTGDSWKQVIQDSLLAKLDRFHTPNTANVDTLFKRFLNQSSISSSWYWQNCKSGTATRNLNSLIRLRGRAVHRGITFHPMSQPEPSMKRAAVIKALNLIYNLMDSTEKKLGVNPKRLPVPPPAS